MEEKLTSPESILLERIAAFGSPRYARRARILLAWQNGLTASAISTQVGLSASRVRYWLRQFAGRRMNIFPTKILVVEAPAESEMEKIENETLSASEGRIECPKTPGIRPDDPMSEAGRKILRFHFTRMLEHEPGTRAGEDIEELHDMRVATRRMRAAFRIFAPYYEPKAIKSFQKGLRQTAYALGAVRDLDVFIQKAARYTETLPETEQRSLDPLLVSWRNEREEARRRMLDYLDSARYRTFCQEFALFLETEGAGRAIAGSGRPVPLVAYTIPCTIYERLAEVRAFGPLLKEASVSTLHALRISCKRLRYSLEFFEEVLGPEVKGVIKEIIAIQDHLGALQDAVVAADLLRNFLNAWAERQKTDKASEWIDIHGVANYLAAKQAEIYELLETFPHTWQRFDTPELRKQLAVAIAAL